METLIQWVTRQGFPCLFQLITRLYCLECGGTRAMRALLHGNLRMSFQYHPLILYAVLVFTVKLTNFTLSRTLKNPRWYLGHETLFVYIAIGIAVVNWIYKNVMLIFFGIDLLSLWS